jgi:hypothetical protein
MSTHTSDTPEAVLVRALHARDHLRLAEIVDLCDQTSVRRFFVDYCETIRPLSLNELLAEHPEITAADAPGALLRYRAAIGDKQNQLPAAVGVQSYDELCLLTPRDFAFRWLMGIESALRRAGTQRANPEAIPSHRPSAELSAEYEVLDRIQLSAERVRLAYRRVTVQNTSINSHSVDYEHLVGAAETGWGLEFRAYLLVPTGGFIEYVSRDEMERTEPER